MWAFANGDSTPYPLQPRVGVINEDVMQRFDLIVEQAGKYGIRLLPVFVNFWDDFLGAARGGVR